MYISSSNNKHVSNQIILSLGHNYINQFSTCFSFSSSHYIAVVAVVVVAVTYNTLSVYIYYLYIPYWYALYILFESMLQTVYYICLHSFHAYNKQVSHSLYTPIYTPLFAV